MIITTIYLLIGLIRNNLLESIQFCQISLESNAFGTRTLPNGKPVRLVDGRHRNKTISDSTRNEREQLRADTTNNSIENIVEKKTILFNFYKTCTQLIVILFILHYHIIYS